MYELIYKEELIENWIKILLVISVILILLAGLVSRKKIQFLIKFWNIHRYFIYKSGSTIPFFTSLNCIFFFLRVIVFSLFFSVYLFPYEFSEFQFYNYLIICAVVTFYIMIKYLIEQTISIALNYNLFFSEINRFRIGLKNLMSIHFYFYLIILIFNPISYKATITIGFILFFIYIVFSSKFLYKKYSDKTLKGLVYFILYLCTFEIAPAIILMLQAFKH